MTKRKDGLYQEAITINGKRKYFYGKTKAEVIRKINKYTDNENSGVTFAHVAEIWENEHREEIGEKTWINYRPHYNDIISIHGKKTVSEITALDVINDLKRCAAQGRSATIVSTRRSLYRMILDYALIKGYIMYNPALGVSMPKSLKRGRREAPEDNVIKTIMTNTDKPFGLFPALLVCTGLRKAEALALTWKDIGETHISVTKALDYANHSHPVVKTPKTEAGARDVPIISLLKPLLKKPPNKKASDLLFPAVQSNRDKNASGYMTERQYEGAWNRYCKAAGLTDSEGKPTITAHNLRHSMATQLFESGIDEMTAQAILGHASPTTTRNIYTHLREKQKAKLIPKLNETMYEIVYGDSKTAEIQNK